MTMKNFVLVGAGGFGREVRAWLGTFGPGHDVAGFVDDAACGVLGTVDEHPLVPGAGYVVCLGTGALRRAVGQRLALRGARLGAVVSPAGMSASTLPRDGGNIYLGMFSISSDVAIGRFVLIQGYACIGHDVVLEDGVTVSSHAFIGGGAVIGADTTIHPHATILPRVKVGRGAIVGAGAVVLKDVPDNVTVFGNPAKVIATRETPAA